jgi:hypothetical protein
MIGEAGACAREGAAAAAAPIARKDRRFIKFSSCVGDTEAAERKFRHLQTKTVKILVDLALLEIYLIGI